MKEKQSKFYAALLITSAAVILAALSVLHDILVIDSQKEWLTHEIWAFAKMVLVTLVGYFLGRNGNGRL
jgi:hypothetical protein